MSTGLSFGGVPMADLMTKPAGKRRKKRRGLPVGPSGIAPIGRTPDVSTVSDWEPGEAGRFRRMSLKGLSTDEAMFSEQLRRATGQSIARMGGRRAARAVDDEPEAVAGGPSAFRGLPTTLRQPSGLAAGRFALPRPPPADPLEQELVEGPVSAQRHLPAGRYTRPLPTSFGQGGAEDDEGIARFALNMKMQAAGREAQVDEPVQSTLQPGKSLGRFGEPFMGSLAEFTRRKIASRDALAAGEAAEDPGAFRREWSPGDPETAEMLAAEEVGKTRRAARRGLPTSMTERRTRVALRAQGLPSTAEDARIERKLAAGEELTPAQEVRKYGREMIPRQMMEAQARVKERELEAQERGSQMAAATTILESDTASPRAKRWAEDVFRGGAGGLASRADPSDLGVEMEEIGGMMPEMPEDMEPLEAERWLASRGVSDIAVNQWGQRRYGWAAWSNRKSFLRKLPVVGTGVRIGEELTEAYPGISKLFK
jgi:hypothetical protein